MPPIFLTLLAYKDIRRESLLWSSCNLQRLRISYGWTNLSNLESNTDSGQPSAAWDAAAEWWQDRVESGDPFREYVHGPALLESCGAVDRKKILDVGCGAGYFSRLLAQLGAIVDAFDYSEELVKLASRVERKEPKGITYRRLDGGDVGDTYPHRSSDLVTGCMSIADIERLDEALMGIRDVLAPGGRFCFSLPHPISTPPENRWQERNKDGTSGRYVVRYFERRRVASGLNRIMGKPVGPEISLWHMPISDWHQLLTRNGFVVNRIIEPSPTPEQVKQVDSLARISDVPEFLIFVATRT